MKKMILCFSFVFVLCFSLALAKQSSKKVKDNPIITQCEKSSLNAPHPETWASCCKAHGGKVKKESKTQEKEGWDCDAESEAKAKELASDEEESELPPPPEESDEALGQ